MLKNWIILLCLLFPLGTMAQKGQEDREGERPELEKPARDFLLLQITHEGWAGAPDSLNIGGLGRGFNAYLCYDFPIKNSHFSFAAGLGVGTANIYFQDREIRLDDTSSLQQVIFLPEQKEYKKYKLSTAYVEAPFELRFYGNRLNRNKGFKAALGLRVGNLIGAHTKGKEEGSKIVYKVNTRRHMENWRFAGTLRLGWGNFSLLGTYNLNGMFKEGQGPELTPYSLGICISGL